MVRFACPRIAAAVLLVCLGFAPGVAAQDAPSHAVRDAADAAGPQLLVPLPHFAPPAEIDLAAVRPPRRPSALVGLYVSFGALQALDAHSTARALDRGAVEANPLMKGIVGNQAGMLAVKAAGTAGVIYGSEKMWKKNRVAAVVFMAAANSAMTWVVQHNYHAAR